MGNTPSDEANNENANTRNNNNVVGQQQVCQQSRNNAASNVNAPSAQATPPGWSVPPPQQQKPTQSKGSESNARPTAPPAAGIYPPPPTYDETMFQSKKPMSGPKNPTAPPATNFGPRPQPTTSAAQYHAAHPQMYSQPQIGATGPQFFPQPQAVAQPPKQEIKFYAQRPVTSGNTPHPTSALPFNAAAMGLDTNIWMPASQNAFPPEAFLAGHDSDGSQLFICRAAHAGDVLPGKYVQSHGCAYVSHGGKEHAKNSFEVLVGKRYRWQHTGHGKVFPNAVVGGLTNEGETLYIGRSKCNGSLTPGKVHPSHKCLYLPYGGDERHFTSYEILMHA